MIGILCGFLEDATNEWEDNFKKHTPIMHLSAYKIRFHDVDPHDVDDIVGRLSENFNVQEVDLYQGSQQIGQNYYELVIKVEYWKSDVVSEEDVEKCHKAMEDILTTKFDINKELIGLHPVHTIIGWEDKIH